MNGRTPAYVQFGREMRLPGDLKFGSKLGEEQSAGVNNVDNLRRKMHKIHKEIHKNIPKVSENIKHRYDTKASKNRFQEEKLVWLFNS